MTLLPEKIRSGEIESPDLLCGGTPCQAFSVAGLRRSLDDDRGNLTLKFCEIADAIDETRSVSSIIFWENVPGVLNTKDNAFGCFLGALAGEDAPLVPSRGRWTNAGFIDGPKRAIAWRVLDAQYFGVAQRRRRVFVVASARDDFDPASVLFEFEGLRRDTPPSRQKGQEPSATIAARFGISRNNYEEVVSQYTEEVSPTLTKEGTGVSRPGFQEDGWYVAVAGSLDTQCGGSKLTHQSVANGHIVAARMVAFGEYVDDGTASSMKARDYKDATDLVAQPMVVHGTQDPCVSDIAFAQGRNNGGENVLAQPIAIDYEFNSHGVDQPIGPLLKGSLTGGGHPLPAVMQSMAVRRLTPRECERLQGFPDDYTAIPNGADGPRYKALGNSWAVPVVKWIGERIARALA